MVASKEATTEYIETISLELNQMAEKAGLSTLAYLFSMAHYEAKSIRLPESDRRAA